MYNLNRLALSISSYWIPNPELIFVFLRFMPKLSDDPNGNRKKEINFADNHKRRKKRLISILITMKL